MIETLADRAAAYYAGKLGLHGPNHRGVDWKSVESQELRFGQLLRVGNGSSPISLNDFGCGYGALVDYLLRAGRAFDYVGYDAAPAMIKSAKSRLGGVPTCAFTSNRAEVTARDYTVASGVFNVKFDVAADEWWSYVARQLDDIAS